VVEKRLSVLLKLWSRTFEPGQTAVIKTTSFVSEIAARLMTRPSKPKAIFLSVEPDVYIATILGGANTRQEARARTPDRLARFNRRLGREAWRLASLSEGEAVAMAWALDMTALAEAERAGGARAMVMDFDEFLAEPEEMLSRLLRHFDCEAPKAEVARIVESPLMQRYSKAQEYAYSAQLRREVLDAARKEHAGEISKGLAWLETAARDCPAIGECVATAVCPPSPSHDP
jgi:hypothetical protein